VTGAIGATDMTNLPAEHRVDFLDRLDDITSLIENARAVPMSSNCMINRSEVLRLLDELRGDVPVEIRRAQSLLDERDTVIAAGRREAERIIADAEAEHARLVSVAEVTVSAEHEASRIVGEARTEGQRMRAETQEWIDTTLATFEQTLHRTLATVERGRDKMRTLTEIGSFEPDPDDNPLPF
jgi:vacuolar-type H+-ATPase subunit H